MNDLPLYLLFSTIIMTTIQGTPSQECPLQSDQIPSDFSFTSQNQKHMVPCMRKALLENWGSVIEYMVKQKLETHKQSFIDAFSDEINRLGVLQEEIVLGTSEAEPAIKWFQNNTHVFITMKLSHRWDSPPCLNTKTQNNKLGVRELLYENVCLVSHQRVNFKTLLKLNKAVVTPEQSTDQKLWASFSPEISIFFPYEFEVKKDGVGTYSMTLLKKEPSLWLFLTQDEKVYPIWLQMTSRYKSEFRQYQNQLQQYKQSNSAKKQSNFSQSQL